MANASARVVHAVRFQIVARGPDVMAMVMEKAVEKVGIEFQF